MCQAVPEKYDQTAARQTVSARKQLFYACVYEKAVSIDEALSPLIDTIRQIKPAASSEWKTLIPLAQNGSQAAYERVIHTYLPDIVRISLCFYQLLGLPVSDAINSGCCGLIAAVDRFLRGGLDSDFPAYIPTEIRQSMMREVRQTDSPCFQSLEVLLESNENALSDQGLLAEEMFEKCMRDELIEALPAAFRSLTDREYRVLVLRYGLEGNREHTLDEMGCEFHVSQERIRQIIKSAIWKLRLAMIRLRKLPVTEWRASDLMCRQY